MASTPETDDKLHAKLQQLTDREREDALAALRGLLDHTAVANLESCARCGLCADTCHYYLTSGESEALPAYKLNLVSSVYRKHFTSMGRRAGALVGATPLNSALLERWVDSLFGRCSLCGRCSLNCTMGINVARIIRLGRTVLAAAGLVPPELQATVTTAIESGNNMGIARTEWLETLEWLEEELQTETGDPDARLPVDQMGARYLYTVNPREPKFFPLSLLAAAKVFYAAKESWTVASDYYDVTNYGLFSGDDREAGVISARLRETTTRLGAGTLILGECGHGYNANRWEAPEWLTGENDFPVKSILEVVAAYIREGRIAVDPARNSKPVTLHDPCNLVRFGGVSEAQRFILGHVVADFQEMSPTRNQNFCCGGGGGQLSMTRYAKRRLAAGRVKADQIRITGAEVVVAPCHNCIDQLSELNREYKLGVEVKTVTEMVADALVLEPPATSKQN